MFRSCAHACPCYATTKLQFTLSSGSHDGHGVNTTQTRLDVSCEMRTVSTVLPFESVHRISGEVVRGNAEDIASECCIISTQCASYLVECLECHVAEETTSGKSI
jgi:hypothetical protein